MNLVANLKKHNLVKIGIQYFFHLHNDSLYRNSFYLIASQAILSVFGFLFWVISAQLYEPSQIGIATTLISITNLITSFSLVGLNSAAIRFLPKERNRSIFANTSFTVVGLTSLIISLLLLLGLPIFSPPLAAIPLSLGLKTLLLAFMVVATINALTDSLFIAMRDTKFILITATILSILKLFLPFMLIGLGSLGVFYSYAVAVIVACFLSLYFLRYFGIFISLQFSKETIKRVSSFAVSNYMAGLFGMLNATITPILITNSLGPSTTAYYYMPTMILSFLLSFPRSIGSSMFAEGSHREERLRTLFLRSIKATYSLLLPSVMLAMILGPLVLSVFGKDYSDEGITYLRLTLISTLISVPAGLMSSILNIKKKMFFVIGISVAGAILGVTLTVLALPYGLTGIGTANIVGQTILLCIYSAIFYYLFFRSRKKLRNSPSKIPKP